MFEKYVDEVYRYMWSEGRNMGDPEVIAASLEESGLPAKAIMEAAVSAPVKVSWQNETRLRFALKGIRPGQVPSMCEAVGLRVVALRRIRLGRVPLAKMPEGQWRYLQPWEKF